MVEVRSLRVPASVVQRVLAIWRWIAPTVLAGMLTGLGVGFKWFESRTSRADVAKLVAAATLEARAAKATAFHADELAKAHAVELRALWAILVTQHAELVVLRGYSKIDAATRGEYIGQARAFFTRELEVQLRQRPTDPAEAARLAMLAQWRPER